MSSSSFFSMAPPVLVEPETPSSEEEKLLNYLAVGSVVKEHIKRDTMNKNKIWFQTGHHINLGTARLLGVLLSEIANDTTAHNQLQEIASLLLHCLIAKYGHKNGSHLYEALFRPNTTLNELEEPWRISPDVDREEFINASAKDFLAQVISGLEASHFSALTLNEFNLIDDISMELSHFTLPVQIDWDKLDSGMLTDFYHSLLLQCENQESLVVPEYAARCMIFWRGLSVQQKREYFRLQKFDLLLQRITKWTGLDKLSSFIIKQTKIANNIDKESANKKVSGDKEQSIPVAERQTTTIHRPTCVNRKALDVSCMPWDFFHKETVEEPVFDEVVLLFRKDPTKKSKKSKKETNPNSIFVQRFNTVPLKDYAHIFPAKRSGTNFADVFYFAMVLFWLFTMFFKLQHAWASATYLDEAAMGILFVFLPLLVRHFVKSVSSMRTHRQHQSLAESFVENSLQCNKTVLSYIRDEAVSQEFMNILLAYSVLRKNPYSSSTKLDIQNNVENFLQAHFGLEVDYNADEACEALKKHNMVNYDPTANTYQVCSHAQCSQNLQNWLLTEVECAFSSF